MRLGEGAASGVLMAGGEYGAKPPAGVIGEPP